MAESTAEQDIRAQFAHWTKAVEARDIEGIVATYDPGIVAFDAVLALRFEGIEAYAKHWQACIAHCEGPMVFKLYDLTVETAGDLAFCHALTHCGGTAADGTVNACWMRMTACLRRRDGRWKVVHEHYSVPFDMEMKARFDLEPDRAPEPLVA